MIKFFIMERYKGVYKKYFDPKRAKVATLCDGGVLRSQVAAAELRKHGVDATAFAVRNVINQTYQGVLPPHILAFLNENDLDASGQIIAQLPDDYRQTATHFLALCDPDHLPPDLLQDQRLTLGYVPDVKSVGDLNGYIAALSGAKRQAEDFYYIQFSKDTTGHYEDQNGQRYFLGPDGHAHRC
jgi:hypothetical protein